MKTKEILIVVPDSNYGGLPKPTPVDPAHVVAPKTLWTASREFLHAWLIVLVIWMVLAALIGFLITAGLFLLGVVSVLFAIAIPYGAGMDLTGRESGGRLAYEMRRAGSIRLMFPMILCCILSFALISISMEDFPFGVVGWLFHKDKKPTSAQVSTAKETKADRLKKGMSYEQVVKIMGSEGKKIPGEKEAPEDALYEWSDDRMLTRVTFRNGKVIAIQPNIPAPDK